MLLTSSPCNLHGPWCALWGTRCRKIQANMRTKPAPISWAQMSRPSCLPCPPPHPQGSNYLPPQYHYYLRHCLHQAGVLCTLITYATTSSLTCFLQPAANLTFGSCLGIRKFGTEQSHWLCKHKCRQTTSALIILQRFLHQVCEDCAH